MTARLVRVAESVRAALIAAAETAHPIETGGIVIGVMSARIPWITDFAEIDSDHRGPAHYVLPKGATTPVVDRARREDPRLGYLGEWHSHPADVGASGTDHRAMRRIALLLKRAPSPVLLVVRFDGVGYDLDAYRVRKMMLRPARLSLTGDLPPRK